jgi:adenylate kinase family enzyme
MRIVVVGTSGAGKTTLARRIAALLELPHIELDAFDRQSEWRDLTRHDPEEFVSRVAEAIQAEAWVLDGNYGPVVLRLRRPGDVQQAVDLLAGAAAGVQMRP